MSDWKPARSGNIRSLVVRCLYYRIVETVSVETQFLHGKYNTYGLRSLLQSKDFWEIICVLELLRYKRENYFVDEWHTLQY